MIRSYAFGEFLLEVDERRLLCGGGELPLPPKVFDTLLLLVQNSGHLVTKDEFLSRLWPDTFVGEDTLAQNISLLRKVLGGTANGQDYVATVPKRGYRFVAPLRAAPKAGNGRPERVEPNQRVAKAATITPTSRQPKVIVAFFCLLTIVVARALVWRASQARSAASIRSIAVLPLENLSADVNQDYFADGMTDELITNLGQIGSIRVISRTSIMKYKGVHNSLPQIANELDVDGVVDGTVLRSGDRVRITAQLIQARTDRHLWAESYEGDVRDVLSLQNEVARAIAGKIRIRLTPEQFATKNQRAIRPEAYEAYLRAIHERHTVDGLQQTIRYLEQALAKEPDYPEAHSEMSYAYVMLGHMVALPPRDAFPKAKAEALKALASDDSLADAHVFLAETLFLYDWDFPGAEKELKRALSLNSNSTMAHSGYSDYLIAMGHADEAIAERVRNRQIDPLSLEALQAIGWEEYWAGRYDLTIEKARTVLKVNPNSYAAHLSLGLALEQKHEYPEAIAQLQEAADQSNDRMWTAFVAHAKAQAGDKSGAHRILAKLQALSQHSYVSPWCFAIIYAGLGDKKQAFFWLEKCYEGREHDLVFSRVWPVFDPIRSDPRYNDLLRRVGLPQ